VGGRRGFWFGSILVGAGLLAGVVIGRFTRSRGESPEELPLASSRFTEELTDTTPVAAPAPEPELPAAEVPAAPPGPTITPAPPSAAAAPDAGAAPPAAEPPPSPEPAPPVVVAPAADAGAAPPERDPYLVRQGRVFDDDQVTSSSWDEEDVSEYSVVPDREVTSSSFDDQDKVNEHPTGP
jgi:hypothetical protein